MLSWRLANKLLLLCLAALLVAGGFAALVRVDDKPVASQGRTSSDSSVQPSPSPAPVKVTVRSQQTVVPSVTREPKHVDRNVVAELPETTTKDFGTVGVTWSAATREQDVTVEIRTRSKNTWSSWHQLDLEDMSAGGRPGTEPIWVGHADGVAARVRTASGATPKDIKVMTIDAGTAASDSQLSGSTSVSPAVYSPDGTVDGAARTTAAAADGLPPQPTIILRSDWGARAPTPCDSPRTVDQTKGAVLHHTAGSNSYTKEQSAAIVRGDQAYHMDGHGWCDIGYNFLVDKYGQIFEGRSGGITNQVRAAHSGNNEVNTYAMGVAMAGTFETVEPASAMKDAVVQLMAWRFGQMGLQAKGTWHVGETLTGTYGRIDTHTLNIISGHRNVVATQCPGQKAYNWISASGGLRDRVESILAQSGGAIPSSVEGLAVSGVSSTGATVSWDAVPTAVKYRLYVSPSSSMPGKCEPYCSVVVPSDLDAPSRVLSGLTSGGTYYVKVSAINGAGKTITAWQSSPLKVQLGATNTSTTSGTNSTVVVPSSRKVAFKGHGYGHGIGMSQYGAEGAARAGKSASSILSTYYPGTSQAAETGSIRVLLSADTTDSVMVEGRSDLIFRNVGTNKTLSLPTTIGGKKVIRWSIDPLSSDKKKSTLRYRTSSTWLVYAGTTWTGPAQFEAPTLQLVMPSDADQTYRTALRSVPPKSGATNRDTVNVLSIENYTRGVVAREMPSSWHEEALQAQSIAARTYGVRAILASRYYDICDTTSCQVYGGFAAETSSTDAAVAATTGTILIYQGAPALTQFSSSSGGYTAAGSAPYLVAHPDPWDDWAGNAKHSWTISVSASTIEKAYSSIGTLQSMKVLATSAGDGRVTSLKLVGSKGSTTIKGTDARFKFGLYSHMFGF